MESWGTDLLHLFAFVDADYASSLVDRKSAIECDGNIICWNRIQVHGTRAM